VLLLGASAAWAQDWPQWLGPNRDARATGFKAPKTWPKELTKKWKIAVGDGVATPALVGDKLYVFSRQDEKEVIRCLKASSGEEVWQDKYQEGGATGAARSFSGPRASPAVADGKVVTLGVRGTLSCYDAASGKKLWRKDDLKSYPKFFVSSSPIIVDRLCIAQLGGQRGGGIIAYDLATGNEKWKWTGDGPAYASPVLVTVGGTRAVVAVTAAKVVAVGVADGKLLWQTPFAVSGRGRAYNASTPVVEGQTVIYSGGGRGTRAVKLEKKDGMLTGTELWSNDNSVQFNTPVLMDGRVYGLSQTDTLFCIDSKGKTLWTSRLGGGGRGRPGYGSIIAAGSVLMALTPRGQLVVFPPSDKEFKQLASYKLAEGGTYAYPVVSGNRLFIKDSESLTLWTVD